MNYLLKEKENIFITSYIESNNQEFLHQFIKEELIEKEQIKKIVYILPLKSLCNQLYHYYNEYYKSLITIGIITGERKVNTNSKLIIMTPEILLQLLYKN